MLCTHLENPLNNTLSKHITEYSGYFLKGLQTLLEHVGMLHTHLTWGSGPLLHMAWYPSLQGTGFNLLKYRWCYEFWGVSHCFVWQGYLCPRLLVYTHLLFTG